MLSNPKERAWTEKAKDKVLGQCIALNSDKGEYTKEPEEVWLEAGGDEASHKWKEIVVDLRGLGNSG